MKRKTLDRVLIVMILAAMVWVLMPEKLPNKTVLQIRPDTVPMNDALLIGDSRTVGLAEYADLEGANFFASVGMTTKKAAKCSLSVAHVGKLTLDELLEAKKYGKIYIMLGINELEADPQATAAQLQLLLEHIRQLQPGACVILQGNLHVTAERSREDPYYNNSAIDTLNAAIAQLADGREIFYLDPNALLDDESGALDPHKSADNAHLLSQYYEQWGRWLKDQTGQILAKAEGDRVS